MRPDELIQHLEGVKRSGAGYIARCPAHQDRRQSLSVSEGEDGRVLLHCHAGCSVEDICAALGITSADLFADNGSERREREIVATYDYTDEAGTLLYQVVRFAPKDFRQRRPDGASGWVWKLGDTRRVLYHLPEVVGALFDSKPVYIVEGEKDADALRAHGIVATCNPGGAGKWRAEYAEALVGCEVVIVADKDEPGHKHAYAVATSLIGKAADIKIVEAAEGKDAFDHLAAGKTIEEFVPAPAATSQTTGVLPATTLAELMSSAPERPEYVWTGYLARGAITELAAKPKAGKTRFALEAIAHVLVGEDFLGHATFECPVLYMTEESRSTFISGVRRARITNTQHMHVLMRGSVRSLQWDQVGELALSYVQLHKIGLVAVDTLSDWAGLRGDDENSAGAAMAAVAPLRALADAGCAVLAMRHEGKAKVSDLSEGGRGSSAFAGAMDILVRLTRTRGRGHENRRVLAAVGRFDETPETVTVELVGAGYVKVMEGAAIAQREHELAILEALDEMAMTEEDAVTTDELARATGLQREQVRRAVKVLLSRDTIKATKRGRDERGHGGATTYWHESLI